MGYFYDLSPRLRKTLKKTLKKDRVLHEAAMKKIQEIIQFPDHYKPLRNVMKGQFRVHLMKSFVLTFKIDYENQVVTFLDLEHHDQAY